MSHIFTDIAGFTTLSENAGPEAVSKLLNQYLSGACEVIFGHEGTVTDFIGDAVFAMFNAPLRQDDHAVRALACARDLDAFSEPSAARTWRGSWGWGSPASASTRAPPRSATWGRTPISSIRRSAIR